MRIYKYVEFGQEVEIDLGVDDINGIFADMSEQETAHAILFNCSRVATLMSAMDPKLIECLSQAHRETIGKYFPDHATKFDPSIRITKWTDDEPR